MIKRITALLIALLLLVGMVPSAFAEELPDSDIPGQETEAIQDEPIQEEPLPNENSIMALASTQNSIMLFDYADNGNYTTVLNSQVTCAYKPNGSGTTRTAYIKNMGWHFARYGGVAYADEIRVSLRYSSPGRNRPSKKRTKNTAAIATALPTIFWAAGRIPKKASAIHT